MRTEELKRIAAEHQLVCVTIPKDFPIRWTEWTYKSIIAVLRSWKAIVKYCEQSENAAAPGFGTFLKNLENLKLLVFLADLLQIYHRYHQHVQSDKLTIVSLSKHIGALKATLLQLENNDTIGGWAERLKSDTTFDEEEGKFFLKDIELISGSATRSVGRRNFGEIRSDVIKNLIEILEDRFLPDEQLIEIVQPFIAFDENADIRQIHAAFGTDLQLASLDLEFKEIVHLNLCSGLSLSNQMKKLIEPEHVSKYDSVLAILCRINACTPQSADVERSIKANNLFKTAFRNRLSLETENKYMHVYFNMPPLERWNPRNAIVSWLNAKDRREHADLLQREKAQKRSYFKGIFQLAENSDDDEDSTAAVDTHIKF